MNETILTGQAASPGIAIGKVVLLPGPSHPKSHPLSPKKIPKEMERLLAAFKKGYQQFKNLSLSHPILEAHAQLLADNDFRRRIEKKIGEKCLNAEAAILEVAAIYKKKIKSSEGVDVVTGKLLQILSAKNPFKSLGLQHTKNAILVAESLSPAQVATLSQYPIGGFVTRHGTATSHALILAKSLQIPAILGIEEDFSTLISGESVILNGFEKKIVLRPGVSQQRQFRELAKKQEILEKLLLKNAMKEASTQDGEKITLEANIELVEELGSVLKYGAEGIGLFRSESLFWDPTHPPSVATQKKIYEKLMEAMKGRPVTIRTMDLSGEEWWQTHTPNPALGLRGIRFSLKEGVMFAAQLEAIVQASQKGPVRVLLPMVSRVEEVEAVRKMLPKKIPLGAMIEVPATCFMIEALSPFVDFFAIGTNDLIQYLMAADRNNEHVADQILPWHPAVLKAIAHVVQESKRLKKPLYLCGELGSDPLFLPVLIGFGITHLSMNPLSIPKAKKVLSTLSLKQCVQMSQELLKNKGIAEMKKTLQKFGFNLTVG